MLGVAFNQKKFFSFGGRGWIQGVVARFHCY